MIANSGARSRSLIDGSSRYNLPASLPFVACSKVSIAQPGNSDSISLLVSVISGQSLVFLAQPYTGQALFRSLKGLSPSRAALAGGNQHSLDQAKSEVLPQSVGHTAGYAHHPLFARPQHPH